MEFELEVLEGPPIRSWERKQIVAEHGASYQAKGEIDDLRIYNRALSEEEMGTLSN